MAYRDLNASEVESRMATDGFAEMRWLWQRFTAAGADLNDIDEAALAESRKRHMGALTSHPIAMVGLSFVVATAFFCYLDSLVLTNAPSVFDRIIQVLFSLLGVYLFWFLVAAVQRDVVHSWKTIASIDLAAMLRRKSYRGWFDATARAIDVVASLRELGVNEQWDNPDYRAAYTSHGGEVKAVEVLAPVEAVQKALQDVLGRKVERMFQPGRYFSHLKRGKKSINRFIREQGEAISRSREGTLPTDEAIPLLTALREELKPNSAGDAYLAGVLDSLAAPGFLGKGIVEAYVWARDPWVDLTHSQDFYSSASLPGNRLWDRIERRSKGMLGPFGYLRNKSISALDFRTGGGRCVRARLAAARCKGVDGAVLFVDAVEGRFDIKPALIRRAIEDYARAAGFRRVFYHMFPLNRVPLRFVHYLASVGLPVEELDTAYVDAGSREYLDAFGLPIEPFEYAYPRGKVIGYCIDLGDEPTTGIHRPGRLQLAYHGFKGKSVLWIMLVSAFISLAWVLYRVNPQWLLPGVVLFGGAIVYEIFVAPRFRRRVEKEDGGS